ncbi:hypothetical protein EG329_001470 [Mollisiaceae sp. DMI_Dod_QoI]|nr:hypothetical protein EG329_001470 [Helotiales sp. DMI_Dod_QoI]
MVRKSNKLRGALAVPMNDPSSKRLVIKMLASSPKSQATDICSYDKDPGLEASSSRRTGASGMFTDIDPSPDRSSFQFVDEFDYRNPRNRKKILSIIRSQVKVNYHAKQRKSGVRLRAPKRALRPVPVAESKNICCHDSLIDLCIRCRHPNTFIKRTVEKGPTSPNHRYTVLEGQGVNDIGSLVRGTWREDPFNVYNLPNDPRVPFLVSHFNERFERTYTTLEGHRVNFTVNLMFPILQHGILYHTGAFLLARNSSIVDENFVTYHRTRSMRLIRDALDDPIKRTSDQTIAALLYLTLYEYMYGTQETSAIHRNGLHQVLKLRKSTGQRISWFLRMYLPLYELHLLTDGKVDLSSSTNLNDGVITVIPAELRISDSSMWSVFERLKEDSKIILALPPKTILRDRRRIGYETNVKIERFLKILDIDSQRTNGDRDTHRSWLFASLIYLHTIIATPDEMSMLPEKDYRLIYELKCAVERLLEVPKDLGYSARVLLWVLLFGALHSAGELCIWFKKAISRTCLDLRVKTWSKVKKELIELPWVHLEVEQKLLALCELDQPSVSDIES